jgi:hypothetical protein
MEAAEQREQMNPAARPRMLKVWRWTIWSVILAAAVLSIVFQILIERAGPILKGRVIETLSTRFNSHVELDNLQVSVLRGLSVTGGGLRISPPDDVIAAGAKSPLIAIESFEFHASPIGLMFKPMHVGTVHVRGLVIDVPPRSMREQNVPSKRHGGKTKIEVDEIVCDDSRLVIGTDKPNKDPKIFELKHIVLHDVGPNAPWPYDAVLTNAVPRGDIHATGTFGPWNTETPGDSSVTGSYTFENADLNTIKGIGGMLHSTGNFRGQLDRIGVEGTADVPNFSLDTANHPVPLATKFSAVVDGTTGDTYLNSVNARLGESKFSCSGAVVNVKGKGHTIDLDVYVPGGRIQDFLLLAVKTEPVVMSGIMETKTKLHISPGVESVTRKLAMKGGFVLRQIHFTNPAVEDKVDMLSLRAEGHPKEAKPGAADVQSRMTGQFEMGDGKLTFSSLDYALPGATVKLAGVYSLDGRQFEFTGKVRTEAKISQMVASRWKSLLLKPVDPFFHKDGAGAEIPVKISGTEAAPHFGLDLHDHKK